MTLIQRKEIQKMVLAGLCLALCMLLPFLTGQIPQIGSMLSPMHIPVLLCGFICGWKYGLLVGAIAPIMRHLLFGMPPLPTAIAMAFELAAYGLAVGILYQVLPKKNLYIYVTLITSMILGRIVWGVASIVVRGIVGESFTFAIFLGGALFNAIPGIILHIVLIPIIVILLKRANLLENNS